MAWPDDELARLWHACVLLRELRGARSKVLRTAVEAATDLQMSPVLAAIGDDVAGIVPLLEGWSRAITEHGWFPPDPYKAAAG